MRTSTHQHKQQHNIKFCFRESRLKKNGAYQTLESSSNLIGNSLFKKNWANPGLFFVYFRSFSNKHYNFYNMWKNVHPVYGAGIRTHDLRNVSLFPLPLDQGSRLLIGNSLCQLTKLFRNFLLSLLPFSFVVCLCRSAVYLCRCVFYLCRSAVCLRRSAVYLCRSVFYLFRSAVYLYRSVVYLYRSAVCLCRSVVYLCRSVFYLCRSDCSAMTKN